MGYDQIGDNKRRNWPPLKPIMYYWLLMV